MSTGGKNIKRPILITAIVILCVVFCVSGGIVIFDTVRNVREDRAFDDLKKKLGPPAASSEAADIPDGAGEANTHTDGEPLVFKPTERFWEKAPVGGEIGGDLSAEELFGRWISVMDDCVSGTHLSFMGPRCPSGETKDTKYAQQIREKMGYRYYISNLTTEYSFSEGDLEVTMKWGNVGLAPIYWQWPVTMYVYDLDGELTYWESVDIDLSKLAPGDNAETLSHIPFTDSFRKGYRIGVGITSPDESVRARLAMDTEYIDGVQIIYTFNPDEKVSSD